MSKDVPLADVSPGNDWWPPANQMGVTTHATFGSVQAKRPPEHDQLAADARQLTKIAVSE
jgi:hypothetical protein